MCRGVSKSGSPRSRWTTRSPASSRARAAAMTRPRSEVILRSGRLATRRGMRSSSVKGRFESAIGALRSAVGEADDALYHGQSRVVIRGLVSSWGGMALALRGVLLRFKDDPARGLAMSKFDLRDISQR